MIRFLDTTGLPCQVYAIEVDGALYDAGEVERAMRAQQGEGGAKVCGNGAQMASRGFCEVPGCGEKRTGLSRYCKKHDMRVRRHGDPKIVLRAWDRKKQEIE
jgi:hypothetical protein